MAVVQCTFTNRHYTEQLKIWVLAVPHLCGFYPGICLTTEEKARKNFSQVSRRVSAGTMKIHIHTNRHKHTVREITIKIHKLRKSNRNTTIYTGCPRRKGPDFGRVFLRSYYTDITQNTYIQSSMVTEILARRSLKLWQLLLTYWVPNTYWNWQEYVVSVVLISVHNIKVTCEWHKAIK